MNTKYKAFKVQADKMYIKYNRDILKLNKLIYTEEEKVKYSNILSKSIRQYLVSIFQNEYDEFILKYNIEREKKRLDLFLEG